MAKKSPLFKFWHYKFRGHLIGGFSWGANMRHGIWIASTRNYRYIWKGKHFYIAFHRFRLSISS